MATSVLLITGTVGVGKTTVLREIGEVLRLADVPHARIDLDWLSYARPPISAQSESEKYGRFGSDLVVRNLASVWPNYANLGIERLALARAIDDDSIVEGIASAIPGSVMAMCRLTAPPAVIAQRVAGREAGLAKPFLLRLAAELAEHGASCAQFEIPTAGRSVTDIAQDVLVQAGWLNQV